MSKCRHLSISGEAYRVTLDGHSEPVGVFLCNWVRNQPFVPPWLLKRSGSIAVDHATECQNCPCHEKAQPQ